MGRGAARLLIACGFLAVGLLVAEITDWRMKHGPFRVPADIGAGITLYAADGPALWRAAAESPPGAVAAEHFSPFLDASVLAVRKATGIRPTPGRWRLWLGQRTWLHWDGQRTIAAFRPGLLFRSYWMLSGGQDGGMLWGWNVHWRDGMLLLVSDGDWPGSELRIAALPGDPPPQALIVTCRISDGSNRYRLQVDLRDEWPFRGEVTVPETAPKEYLVSRPLDIAFPMRPAVTLAATEEIHARLLGRMLLDTFGCDDSAPTPANLARCLLAALPLGDAYDPFLALVDDWQETAEHWRVADWPVAPFSGGAAALAFYGFDLADWYALPRWAAVAELPLEVREDTASAWPPGIVAIPFEWHGTRGYRVPLLSERLELCVADAVEQRFISSNETIMEQLVADAPEFGGTGALLAARVAWGAFARNLQQHSATLLDGGFFGDYDALTFNRNYGGLFTGLAALGDSSLHLTPHPGGANLVFAEGHFFSVGAEP